MKNKIVIEGKEFELPDELVNKIKEELSKPKAICYRDVLLDMRGDGLRSCGPVYTTSSGQSEKLMAINKLMNVAKYLNGDWVPEINSSCSRYFIYYKDYSDEIGISSESDRCVHGAVFFKSLELAKSAISILGKDVIKVALLTGW